MQNNFKHANHSTRVMAAATVQKNAANPKFLWTGRQITVLFATLLLGTTLGYGQTWQLTPTITATLNNGTLTVSGTGDMPNYNSSSPFSSNNNIVAVIIETGVTGIGRNAFFGCSHLTSITIPASVTGIGEGAFLSCSSLTAINLAADNPNYSSEDGVLFNKEW